MAFKKVVLATVCAFVLTSCTVGEKAPDEELSAALAEHVKCLVEWTEKVDDGASKAATIARVTRRACYPSEQHYVDLAVSGHSSYLQKKLRWQLDDTFSDVAIRVVLEARKHK